MASIGSQRDQDEFGGQGFQTNQVRIRYIINSTMILEDSSVDKIMSGMATTANPERVSQTAPLWDESDFVFDRVQRNTQL